MKVELFIRERVICSFVGCAVIRVRFGDKRVFLCFCLAVNISYCSVGMF